MSGLSTAAATRRQLRQRVPAGTSISSRHNARKYRLWTLAPRVALVGYVTLHVVGTHIPPGWFPDAPGIEMHVSDKLIHFLSYTGMTLALLAALLTIGKIRRVLLAAKTWWLLPVLCLSLAAFGLFDELTQPLVGRNFDWFDWLANVAGISTAALLVAMGVSLYGRRTQAAG